MAETKIIKAVFGGTRSTVTQPRYRYDYGQILEVSGITLPESFGARFSNAPTGASVRVLGQNQRVAVPDELLRTGKSVWCYITVHDAVTDGRTMYTIRIPIKDATERTDAEPTPVQQDVIEQAIAALNAAVEKTAQDVESADASAQSAKADADRAETARDTTEEYVSTVQGYAQQAQTSATNASSSAMASANSASQAQQIKTDVEGMVDEAQSAAGASAQSALESEQSASQASASATSASQSADTASTKASEASASAQTAGTKAGEASTSAQTASQKAAESSQSASSASGYATAAGQAKTAAETAQGLAEQAQSDAESAKDDAESARDEAQQIVSGISSKVEQIDQNTSNIASLEADRYKAFATDTASGSIAHFEDGADSIPMKDVLVHIEPVQEGSGDPSPDNIRPITGWTGCEVQRTGKNLFDVRKSTAFNQNVTLTFNADGSMTCKNDNSYAIIPTASIVISVPNGTYTVSASSALNGNVTFYASDDGVTYSWYANGLAPTILSRTITINKPYIALWWQVEGNATDTLPPIQLEPGSTPTAYEPYQGNTYPITFPSEAGTVYGGYVDVINGELVVDREISVFDGSSDEQWAYYAVTHGNLFRLQSYSTMKPTADIIPAISNAFKAVLQTSRTNGTISSGAGGTNIDFIFDGANSLAEWREWLAENNVQLCYELAEPIHYPLTPTEIKTLLGQNNLWANTGDTEVEYRADTILYINKKIAEAVSALS